MASRYQIVSDSTSRELTFDLPFQQAIASLFNQLTAKSKILPNAQCSLPLVLVPYIRFQKIATSLVTRPEVDFFL